MKQVTILICLFCVLGGTVYLFIHLLLTPAKQIPADDLQSINLPESSTSTTSIVSTTTASTSSSSTVQNSTDIDTNTDGPFSIVDTREGTTTATIRILRSPEEVLLQFTGFNGTYTKGSHIYLTTNLQPSGHIDLGEAQLGDGVYVYGMPLDIDQTMYPYLVIYDTQNNKILYYAHIN